MKSSRIKITKKQSHILEILITNTEKTFGDSTGLSQSGIESRGVHHSTFSKNCDKLLGKHLIRLINVRPRGEEEEWHYYDVTVLGFLICYQKLINDDRSEEIQFSSFERFFPLIFKHWKELEKIFQNDRE